MNVIAGIYECPRSSTYFRIIKVHFQNETKLKVKAAFILKNSGLVVEVKNYTIQKKNINEWKRLDKM